MSFQLTRRVIKLLCGPASYDSGEQFYQANKVTYQKCDHEASEYEATVQDTQDDKVQITIDSNGDVDAQCTCSSYMSDYKYCKHIAAVLLDIHDNRQGGDSPIRSYSSYLYPDDSSYAKSGRVEPRTALSTHRQSEQSTIEEELTRGILKLFHDKPQLPTHTRPLFDAREALDVEFICRPFYYGQREYMFGIEMKVGSKRLYIVQRIRDFLDHIISMKSYVFTKNFTYDPERHSFSIEHDAIIQQLIQVYQNEKLYQETSYASVRARSVSGDRMLLIPPFSWESLLPLLAQSSAVKLELGNHIYEGFQLSDEALPLKFAFDQSQDAGYQLNVDGLDAITVMESYGIVIYDGKLIKLPIDECKRLSDLKHMLEANRKHQIKIPEQQMEPFMDQVLPGLMKLGRVQIAQAVSERIVQTKLEARLYLDRVRDRLLAGLEFQYGDIIINPLEGNDQRRGEGRILIRDGEQERRILALMEQSDFARTESGYFMDNEESEFDFLYEIVPQLEKLVKVYATSSVKLRLQTGYAPPNIKVDIGDRTDWLEIRFDMEGIPESDIRSLLTSIEEKSKYHRLPNGSLLPLDDKEFHEIIRFMNEVGIRKADFNGTSFRVPIVRGMHLMDPQNQGTSIKLGKSLRKLLDNMRNPDHLDFPVPDHLAPVLRDYQTYGFQWLKTLANYRFGGILADDMGLGKTIQSIAFILSVLPEIRSSHRPALIISPASLVYNWLNELKKFAPEIRAVIADGNKSERTNALNEADQVDVIITSYPLLRRDIVEYVDQTFHTLILDEAQTFKNHTTQTAHAVKAIEAEYRFALTGTPVENRLEELWSIFNVVFPELFPNRKEFGELSRETISKRIRPFLLRRLKTDVLRELPDKIESLQASELLPEQKKLYVAYLAKLQQETVKHLNDRDFQKNRIKILAGLTRLRQLCCHPSLFVDDYEGSSAKFEQLLEIVEECRSAGKRMLIFSQFTEMLGLIGRELGYQGVPHFYLDGSTPTAKRIQICDRFNSGERDLFLISLKAGGTGLNLTGADTVILYDLWWNPAVEQQAADRAHRIGQKKIVQVIRLVAQGTVEDKMYELQQKKMNLIDEVIKPGQEGLSSLTEQDIKDILMING